MRIHCMVTVPHKMVGLERMSDYRGVGLQRFHCMLYRACRTHTQQAQNICLPTLYTQLKSVEYPTGLSSPVKPL